MKSFFYFKQDNDGGAALIVSFGLTLVLNFPLTFSPFGFVSGLMVAAHFLCAAWPPLKNFLILVEHPMSAALASLSVGLLSGVSQSTSYWPKLSIASFGKTSR